MSSVRRWVSGWKGDSGVPENKELATGARHDPRVGAADRRTAVQEPKPVETAWAEFLADLEARNLHESTLRKYKLLKRQMEEFAQNRGIRFLGEFDLALLSQFRNTWKDGARSSGKKLERLRALFRFGQRMGWVQKNPAIELKTPKVTTCPTLPYSHEEVMRILTAVDQYRNGMPSHGVENARRIRGLIPLLLFSGMRIADAVNLSTNRLSGNRLFLYTQKTGTPVNSVLPDFVVDTLEATPRENETHFFWSGVGKLESAVRSWQARLRKVFKLAGVSHGHPHRFRDTFAVELLLAGIPIERVSILLGHQSVRVTEKHYSPWVRSRQEQLEADLAKTWSRNPLVAFGKQGTPGVHGKARNPN